MTAKKEQIVFSRPMGGMAGESLTKQIASHLSIGEEEAEKLKVTYPENTLPNDRKSDLAAVVQNFFDRGAIEIQRSLDAFLAQFPGHDIQTLHFTGGASQMSGLQKFIADTLMVTVREIDPFRSVDGSKFDPETLHREGGLYGVATGLAFPKKI